MKKQTIETVQADIEKQMQELHKLAGQQEAITKKIDDLTVERDQLQLATFNEDLVEEAKFLGINPTNFDTNDQLKEAVKIRKAEK